MAANFANIAEYIYDAIAHARHSKLIDLLDESHAAFNGVSTNEVFRIRGFILSSFKDIGLIDEAIPFVLEELESGRHPYLVAGAARALRGRKAPLNYACDYLVKALNNISHKDDSVSFDDLLPNTASKKQTTAFDEIIETICWYGPHARSLITPLEQLMSAGPVNYNETRKKKFAAALAIIRSGKKQQATDCCDGPPDDPAYRRFKKTGKQNLDQVQLQDHNGNFISYRDFFLGKPTVAVFFYSRCDNPGKCSLSITRLAQLQKMLQEKGLDEKVQLAAITYDAQYDEPFILRNYCANRQLSLGDNARAFRALEGFDVLKNYFRLGVNYVASVVNKHKIELYLTDREGNVQHSFTRVQWQNDAVLKKLEGLLKHRGTRSFIKAVPHNILSVLVFLGIFLFPKCPFCLAAYASALGITGMNAFLLTAWAKYLLAAGLAVNLFVLWGMCRKRNWYLPFYVSCAGAILVVAGALYTHRPVINGGVVLVLLASLMNGVPQLFSSVRSLRFK